MRARLVAAVAIVTGVASIAGPVAIGSENVRAPRAFTVKLLPQHDSGASGTARFTPRGRRSFVVVVTVTGGPAGNYPAHIHTGTCANEPTWANPRIYDTLNGFTAGRSRTVVRHSLAKFRRGRWSLNVHAPTGDYPVIACGDLPRRF